MDEDPRPLSGLVLAVTRPADQARATGDFLGAAGADVVYFPVLAIEALPGTDAKPPASGADSVIFVSANAVEFGWDRLRAGGAVGTHTKVFAIGEATAAALQTKGASNILMPAAGHDSEALLALPELAQVRDRCIVLVRGTGESGGRRLLAETLTARGAQVHSFECYQRRKINAGAGARAEMQRCWPRVQALFALSVETAESLRDNLQAFEGWPSRVLLTPHARVAAAARALGFQRVEVAPQQQAPLVAWLIANKSKLMRAAPAASETSHG